MCIFARSAARASSRYDRERRNVINAGAYTRGASRPRVRRPTRSAAPQLRRGDSLCVRRWPVAVRLCCEPACVCVCARMYTAADTARREHGTVRSAGARRSGERRRKPRRLPPRVPSTFFYSDHRPRATRRAVRTSSYITESSTSGTTRVSRERGGAPIYCWARIFFFCFFFFRQYFRPDTCQCLSRQFCNVMQLRYRRNESKRA